MLVVLDSVQVMTMRYLRVVCGFFVISCLMMLRGFAMVLGCLIVVVRRVLVVLVNLVIRHFQLRVLPYYWRALMKHL
jgi:hypothetical protein